MTKTRYESQYTRQVVLNFLSRNGYRERTDEDESNTSAHVDEKQLKYNALGISIEKINRTQTRKPAMYLATSLASVLLFIVGFVFWCIDLYMGFLNLSGSIYIVWCLCCLSMFFTNKVALREWEKRHGQKD